MKPYCIIIVPRLLPAVRALITKQLIEKYNLTQQEASKKIGISQAAISQYMKHIRGSETKILENNKEVMDKINEVSEKIALDKLNAFTLMEEFCSICRIIRKNKLICAMHQKEYPELKECGKSFCNI